jgi:pantothenate kinase
MDGFHYYRSELDQFPDPQLAHFRRGAHFTFNAEALLRKLQILRSGQLTLFPSFSHSTGDPVEDSISLDPAHTAVVILEGLYLFLEVEHWRDIRGLLDYHLFLEASLDEAMERTFARNARCLPYLPEVVRERVEKNDRVNGELVETTKQYADTIVHFYLKPMEQLAGLE